MSSITDWADDYASADTNTPASATAIPYPAAGTTDLGTVLRDLKKVVREESFNKGWSSDPINATYVSAATFNTAGNLTATYPTGLAVNINLNGTFVYSHISNLAYSAPNTLVTIVGSVLNSNLNTFAPSSVYPVSTPPRQSIGYQANTISALPWKISQIGSFDFANGETSTTVYLARDEYDALYHVLLQPVSSTGTISSSHYRITNVAKYTNRFEPTVAAATSGSAPPPDAKVRWEYCIVRIT